MSIIRLHRHQIFLGIIGYSRNYQAWIHSVSNATTPAVSCGNGVARLCEHESVDIRHVIPLIWTKLKTIERTAAGRVPRDR
jgi:hypothetical protein